MVLILCPAGWETLLTLPLITLDSGVQPATDRSTGREKTILNCSSKQEAKDSNAVSYETMIQALLMELMTKSKKKGRDQLTMNRMNI